MVIQHKRGVGRPPLPIAEPTKMVSVRMPVSVLRALRFMAVETDKTVSDIMREQAESIVIKKYGS